MKQRDPICFISYCHQGVDRDLVDYFVFLIHETMRDRVTVLCDTDLRPANNLTKFMKRTVDVDLAVLLMTPQYKERVTRREGGVYTEYKLITERYWADQAKRSARGGESACSFELLPVVLSGTVKDAVPDTISDLYCINIAGFSVAKGKSGEFIVSDYIKTRFTKEIKKITDHLVAVANIKSQSFLDERSRLYPALFVETKTTDDLLTQCPDFFQEVFVSTTAYANVQEQKSYFLIGRKGSGKSTLATALSRIQPDRYNGCINLSANDVNIGIAFGILRSETRSDIQHILPALSFFGYTWQGFLALCIVELLDTLDHKSKITKEQRMLMGPLKHFIQDFRHDYHASDLKSAFFTFATAQLQEYLDHCIADARPDKRSRFLADLDVSFNVDDYFDFLLGSMVNRALQEIVRLCQKRVLVTLDDFDTIFDTFRRQAASDEDEALRVGFETDWLRSLLLLVLSTKDGKPAQAPYFSTLDFCITIPKDRYQQIERSERDGYRYGPRTSNIDWSGIELCDVLFHRLCKLYGSGRSRSSLINERLKSLLAEEFPMLPDILSFSFNGKNVRIPLFCYVLRHTFWRPRDILMYYADIFAAAFSVSKSGYDVTESVLRRIISQTTFQIIKTEFLDEYETTVSNIRIIVNQFMEYPQVFEFDLLEKAIGDMPFLFNEYGGRCNVLLEKIEFLYDIGFLGVILNPDLQRTLNIPTSDCFFFNEGTSPLRTAKKRDFRDIRFAIHPIFSENLQLSYEENDFLLNFDWKYLFENHTVKMAVRV